MVGGAALLAAVVVIAGSCRQDASETSDAVEEVSDSIETIDPVALETLPEGFDADKVELGRKSYVVCSVCHGLDGHGTALGPSLRDTTWIDITGTAPEIAQVIRDGVANPREFPSPMPVMGGGEFGEEELDALVAYVQALSRS